MLDASENVLYSMGFDTSGDRPDGFLFVLPYPDGTRRIVIEYDFQPVATLLRTDAVPSVELVFPKGGELLDGTQMVTWTASHPEDLPLRYDVLVSRDSGATWRHIAISHEDMFLEWDTGEAAGGDQYLVKVVANDGFNTAFDVSDAVFAIASKAPLVVISEPAPGAVLNTIQPVLSGTAVDPEDGRLDGDSLTWHSDIDGSLGTGSPLVPEPLTPGNHVITLSATDSDGNVSQQQVQVTVNSPGRLQISEHSGIPNDLHIEFKGFVSSGSPFIDTALIRLKNDGTGALTITGIELPEGADDYSLLDVQETPFILYPQEYHYFSLRLETQSLGTHDASIVITSDDPLSETASITINCQIHLPGDVNGDCKVNVLDLIFIRNRLNTSPATGDNWKADVNEDGKINILDLIFVRNRLNTRCE